MTLILEFLAKNWKIVGILLILAGAGAYVEYLRVDNADLTTANKSLKSDNKTLTDNNTKLKDAIATANSALDETQKAADKHAKDMAATQNKINQQNAALKKKLDAIMAIKDPATCEDTLQYLLNNAGGFPK